MTLDEFLALWVVLTIVVAYLGTVTLFCLLVPRFVDGSSSQTEALDVLKL
jgi:hypothetical protein